MKSFALVLLFLGLGSVANASNMVTCDIAEGAPRAQVGTPPRTPAEEFQSYKVEIDLAQTTVVPLKLVKTHQLTFQSAGPNIAVRLSLNLDNLPRNGSVKYEVFQVLGKESVGFLWDRTSEFGSVSVDCY